DREVYSSIIYLEPFSGRNLRAFGYDMFSEPVRRAAMELARDKDAAALSGKIVLVQETDKEVQAGAVMYVPVYRKGMPIKTIGQRRAAIYGWVYSPYRMNDLMQGVLGGHNSEKEKQLHIQLFDGAQPSPQSLLYESLPAGDKKLRDQVSNLSLRFTRQIPVDFNGQRWTLSLGQIANGLSSVAYISVWLTMVGGILITLLLFALTRSLLNTRAEAYRIAENLTAALQETRDTLIQFEKQAAIGRLANGVAHEILNPVSIISSRLQFLDEENLAESARENVKLCQEQLKRIVKISRDLHQSAAKQPGIVVSGDLLHRVIEVSLQATERRIKEDHVQVEYDPLPEIIPVKADRAMLVRVMVNLILNACDAMTCNKLKRLIITVHRPEDFPKRSSIFLTVADNGQGIPAGNMDRIFEPFFTTKDPGKGTGLGLSVSKGIIQEHGGTIYAENNDMGGTSFIVELPLFYP
ncbi:MAG: CHASE domain-containing protein, partial [Deltaproteobacteria bacterium]